MIDVIRDDGRRGPSRKAVAATVAAGAAGSAIFLPAVAEARFGDGRDNCWTSNGVCLWDNAEWDNPSNGSFRVWKATDTNYRDLNWSDNVFTGNGEPINNRVSSVWNKSDTVWVKFFQLEGGRGARICVGPQMGADHLSDIPIPGPQRNWNDKFSAFIRYPSGVQPMDCDYTLMANRWTVCSM